MAPLIFLDADDFIAEASVDAGTTWEEWIVTSWVESEADPEDDTITALNRRSALQVGSKQVQTVAVGQDVAPVFDPLNQVLLDRSENRQTALFRVRSIDDVGVEEDTGTGLSIAADTGVATFTGTQEADLLGNDRVQPGIIFRHGASGSYAYYFLRYKSSTQLTLYPMDETATDSALYTQAEDADSTAASSAAWSCYYPGVRRPSFSALVRTGGAYTIETGQQVQTAFSLAPGSRLPLPVFTVERP